MSHTITLLLEVIQLQKDNFDLQRENIMTEAQQNLSLQTQQELNEEWEYAWVKIVNKAEQIMENHNLEVVEEFNVVDIQVIKVEVIQQQREATCMEDLFKRIQILKETITEIEEDQEYMKNQLELSLRGTSSTYCSQVLL